MPHIDARDLLQLHRVRQVPLLAREAQLGPPHLLAGLRGSGGRVLGNRRASPAAHHTGGKQAKPPQTPPHLDVAEHALARPCGVGENLQSGQRVGLVTLPSK